MSLNTDRLRKLCFRHLGYCLIYMSLHRPVMASEIKSGGKPISGLIPGFLRPHCEISLGTVVEQEAQALQSSGPHGLGLVNISFSNF